MDSSIISDPNEAEGRLREMGVVPFHLRDGLRAGPRFLASLTEFDTSVIKGAGVYNAISRELATTHIPLGWEKSDRQGFRRLIHPEGDFSIVVHSGNRFTGVPKMQPANSYPFMEGKRQALRQAVFHNSLLVSIEQRHFADVTRNWGRGLTYLLLHHITAREIRAELSLPVSVEQGYIVAFRERILLPADRLDDEVGVADIDQGPVADFKIQEIEPFGETGSA